jgi:hypothetical protein
MNYERVASIQHCGLIFPYKWEKLLIIGPSGEWEKTLASGEDCSMPRRGEKAEYPPPEGGNFERRCTLPPPEGGDIQGVHATGYSRWWLTL